MKRVVIWQVTPKPSGTVLANRRTAAAVEAHRILRYRDRGSTFRHGGVPGGGPSDAGSTESLRRFGFCIAVAVS